MAKRTRPPYGWNTTSPSSHHALYTWKRLTSMLTPRANTSLSSCIDQCQHDEQLIEMRGVQLVRKGTREIVGLAQNEV